MSRPTACLVDVYETVLRLEEAPLLARLAAHAGVDPAAFAEAARPWGPRVTDGSATLRTAFAEILTACGGTADDDLLDRMVTADGELMARHAHVFADTVPFLEGLRGAGVRTAFLSNCADNTRGLLGQLGLADLVDELVLSCEVGLAKPDPRIFTVALEQLGVEAGDTVFVDDQPAYCAAAEELGIAAVLLDRAAGDSLTEVLARF